MTALISSFGRIYRLLYDEPKVFNDPVTCQLMSDEEFAQISNYIANGIQFFNSELASSLSPQDEKLNWVIQTQIAPTPLGRAAYCEEMLENSIMLGATQYVILGAGMDTFSYRNTSEITIFEVDHPDKQAFKNERIKMANWQHPNNLHYISLDFDTDNLADALIQSGFDPQKRTFFSYLGVIYYLSLDKILNLLQQIASISTKGNAIVFDYPDEKFFTSSVKPVQNTIQIAQASGEPMKSSFSYSDLETLLDQADFLIYDLLTPEMIQERYFANRGEYLKAFEHINYTLAVFQSSLS